MIAGFGPGAHDAGVARPLFNRGPPGVDHSGIDLPRIEPLGLTRERRRWRAAAVVSLAVAAFGLVSVTASALVGSGAGRRPAATTTPRHHSYLATPGTTTTIRLVTTTTSTVATTSPPATTTTARSVPPSTTSPPMAPPTSAPPTTTVVPAHLQITPGSASFPSTPPPYWPMPIVHVTVTNTGASTVDSVVVHPVGVYSVPTSTCSSLAPGASCGADVQFCPTSPGSYVNTLLVTGDDTASGTPLDQSITLDGMAT